MSEHTVELFLLKGSVLFTELRDELPATPTNDSRTELERYTDALVDRHLAQIGDGILADSIKMGDLYRMFYAVENDIRNLILDTLNTEFGEVWWGQKVPPDVRSNVKKNKEREEKEGIPPRSNRNIDYTSFGELGEIIKSNWVVFQGIFSNSSVERLQRVIARLNLARGPIAHSGVVPPEEAVRLKLAIRDWYSLME